jgi:ankyrin repeat protein
MKKLLQLLIYLSLLSPNVSYCQNLQTNELPVFIRQLVLLQKYVTEAMYRNSKCNDNSIKCLILNQDTVTLSQYLEMIKNGQNAANLNDQLLPSIQQLSQDNQKIIITGNYTIVQNKDSNGQINNIYIPNDPNAPEKLDELRRRNAILRDLFTKQENVNKRDEYGFTSLHYAAAVDSIYITELLIKNGAVVMATNNDFKLKPVHIAVILNSNAVIPQMMNISGREDMDPQRDFNLASLYSYFGSSVFTLDQIINYNFQTSTMNLADKFGNTAIFYAAFANNVDFLEYYLTKQNADINVVNNNSRSVLSYMTEYNRTSMVDYLIKHGAYINSEDYAKRTPIFYAVKNNNQDTINLLLSNNAEINSFDRYGYSPVFYSVYHDNLDFLKEITKLNSPIVSYAPNGQTLLNFALNLDKTDIAKYLIQGGANLNEHDRSGLTPLAIATTKSNYEIAKMLIDMKVDLNAKSNTGNTILHYAISTPDETIALELINSGANCFIANEDDINVAAYSAIHRKKEIFLNIIKQNSKLKSMYENMQVDKLAATICQNINRAYTGPCTVNSSSLITESYLKTDDIIIEDPKSGNL